MAENVKFEMDQSENDLLNQSEAPDQIDVDEIEKDCLSSISYLSVAVTGTKKECDNTDRPLERG